MNFEALNRKDKGALRGRNFLAICCVLLLTANVFLSSALNTTKRTTVLVPTRISDGMVSNGNVDMRYVEAIALDAVYSFYNASPNTSDYGRKAIERIASTRDRPDLLEAFDEVAKDIRDRRLTTTFFVSSIDHDWSKSQIVVHGYLTTFIETKSIDRVQKSVRLGFIEEASSVRLASMEVVGDQT